MVEAISVDRSNNDDVIFYLDNPPAQGDLVISMAGSAGNGIGVSVLALSLEESLTILGVGVLLGLVGSWFAAARHMRRIEPR
jgi:hypothetical protein